jgi:cardiolipin synthase
VNLTATRVAARIQLLVDADEFWPQLQRDLQRAERRVWLQTLSLEADTAGLPLADALLACKATDRRLLVDAFSRHILSDRFIYAPNNAFRRSVREEVAGTRAMLARLKSGGVGVGITNPAGLLWHRLPARDHRKLILIDDQVAYIGGINFSEHNFAWHDVMLRIEDAGVTDCLAADFAATWTGKPEHSVGSFEGMELHNLSGQGNEPRCEPILAAIRGARRSILAITPYLTFPFTDAMAEARARGAAVAILTPAVNNRRSLRRYVLWLAAQHGFAVRHYLGRMSHLKAMLIDDEKLIVGSTNFDWPTYHTLAETVAIITDEQLIADFRQRVIEPDLELSVPARQEAAGFMGWFSGFEHRVWAVAARTIGRPRTGKRMRRL